MGNVLVLAGFLVLMYVILIRPQQKQQKARQQLVASVGPGDDVITIGGLHGTVVGEGDGRTGPYLDLLVTDDVVLRFKRDAVSAVASDFDGDLGADPIAIGDESVAIDGGAGAVEDDVDDAHLDDEDERPEGS